MIKTLNIRNRRERLTFLKSIYEKPIANIILHEERILFPLKSEQDKDVCSQYICTGGFSH